MLFSSLMCKGFRYSILGLVVTLVVAFGLRVVRINILVEPLLYDDNKQKLLKSVNRETNSKILNYGIWQTKTKK